jgi:hypothetical protein
MSAAATIEEARMLAGKLVEFERGKCGGDVDLAMFNASTKYGVDESSLRSLRYRWRSLKFVKAHVFLRLKEINEYIEARAERERQILADTARILEERGSSAAWLARRASDLAGETEVNQ